MYFFAFAKLFSLFSLTHRCKIQFLCSACRVGIVFCGRQSPGGHNVVWGLYDAIKAHNPNSKLIGFLGEYE
jgi:hypothetical protein